MKNARIILMMSVTLSAANSAWMQCANNNTFWVALNPTGPGNTQSTACIWGGEYVTVNVCSGASYTFSTCAGTTWDTQITVYWSTGGASIAYNDDGCGFQSTITWTATATGTVWVLVDAWPCFSNSTCATLSVTQNTACGGASYANDPCTGAITVACGQTISGTTVGATSDAIPGGCAATTGAPGLWYTIVGTGQNITASLCGSGYDTQLSVFTGTCTGLNCVTFNDDYCGTQSQVTFTGVAGTTYYLLVFGWLTASGSFSLNISCATAPVPTNQDCLGAITICNDQSFGGNSSGEGNYVDLNASNQGCLLLAENQTSWYVFSPLTAGTIEFAITPVPLVDYDFAIWGPLTTVSCPPSGPPNWCSYSALYANTGLAIWAADYSESALGDAWVTEIVVTASEINDYYIMVLDNFSVTTTPFTFDWTLTGVTLNCTIMLPIELIEFSCVAGQFENHISWTTAIEHDNAFFHLQRSRDGVSFETIATVAGSNNTQHEMHYQYNDAQIEFGTVYYRLMQVDHDGDMTFSEIVSVERQVPLALVSISPNPSETDITAHIYSSSGNDVTLRWIDSAGKRAAQIAIELDEGSSTIQLDVRQLNPGIYVLQLADVSGNVITHRVCLK